MAGRPPRTTSISALPSGFDPRPAHQTRPATLQARESSRALPSLPSTPGSRHGQSRQQRGEDGVMDMAMDVIRSMHLGPQPPALPRKDGPTSPARGMPAYERSPPTSRRDENDARTGPDVPSRPLASRTLPSLPPPSYADTRPERRAATGLKRAVAKSKSFASLRAQALVHTVREELGSPPGLARAGPSGHARQRHVSGQHGHVPPPPPKNQVTTRKSMEDLTPRPVRRSYDPTRKPSHDRAFSETPGLNGVPMLPALELSPRKPARMPLSTPPRQPAPVVAPADVLASYAFPARAGAAPFPPRDSFTAFAPSSRPSSSQLPPLVPSRAVLSRPPSSQVPFSHPASSQVPVSRPPSSQVPLSRSPSYQVPVSRPHSSQVPSGLPSAPPHARAHSTASSSTSHSSVSSSHPRNSYLATNGRPPALVLNPRHQRGRSGSSRHSISSPPPTTTFGGPVSSGTSSGASTAATSTGHGSEETPKPATRTLQEAAPIGEPKKTRNRATSFSALLLSKTVGGAASPAKEPPPPLPTGGSPGATGRTRWKWGKSDPPPPVPPAPVRVPQPTTIAAPRESSAWSLSDDETGSKAVKRRSKKSDAPGTPTPHLAHPPAPPTTTAGKAKVRKVRSATVSAGGGGAKSLFSAFMGGSPSSKVPPLPSTPSSTSNSSRSVPATPSTSRPASRAATSTPSRSRSSSTSAHQAPSAQDAKSRSRSRSKPRTSEAAAAYRELYQPSLEELYRELSRATAHDIGGRYAGIGNADGLWGTPRTARQHGGGEQRLSGLGPSVAGFGVDEMGVVFVRRDEEDATVRPSGLTREV